MISIMCVIILLMIALATLTIVRGKKVKYTDVENWSLKVEPNGYDKKHNEIYDIELTINNKTMKATEIKYIEKKGLTTIPTLAENRINFEIWNNLRRNFNFELEFVEYPYNSSKNVLKLYYTKK